MKEKGFWEGVQAAVPTVLGYISIGLLAVLSELPSTCGNGLDEPLVYAGAPSLPCWH